MLTTSGLRNRSSLADTWRREKACGIHARATPGFSQIRQSSAFRWIEHEIYSPALSFGMPYLSNWLRRGGLASIVQDFAATCGSPRAAVRLAATVQIRQRANRGHYSCRHRSFTVGGIVRLEASDCDWVRVASAACLAPTHSLGIFSVSHSVLLPMVSCQPLLQPPTLEATPKPCEDSLNVEGQHLVHPASFSASRFQSTCCSHRRVPLRLQARDFAGPGRLTSGHAYPVPDLM